MSNSNNAQNRQNGRSYNIRPRRRNEKLPIHRKRQNKKYGKEDRTTTHSRYSSFSSSTRRASRPSRTHPHRRNRNRGNPRHPTAISASLSSIHSSWKKQLGGLIRWYIHQRTQMDSHCDPMREVERMYTKNQCSLDQTKHAILRAMTFYKQMQNQASKRNNSMFVLEPDNAESADIMEVETPSKWIEMYMVVQYDPNDTSIPVQNYTPSKPKGSSSLSPGLRLSMNQQPGEGPAHSHETWTYVLIPQWAIGKPYHFEILNKSPLDLSCEMTIDDHKVAKNAPIPANSSRTVRPDNNGRYFKAHEWLLQPAKRIKFRESDFLSNSSSDSEGRRHRFQENHSTRNQQRQQQQQQQKRGLRYNGARPNYNNKRMSELYYPDPMTFGWTFTGSVEQSAVEFFEKNLNYGTVLMDFYYTTGIVKTVLEHPTTGRNQLFRDVTDSDLYKRILMNPRAHTGRGFRTNQERLVIENEYMGDEQSSLFPSIANNQNYLSMQDQTRKDEDATMSMTPNEDTDSNNNNSTHTTYYAKNDQYDFSTQGHLNRTSALAELDQTSKYQSWKKAVSVEWACVHAKFHISIANYKYRNAPNRDMNHHNLRQRVSSQRENARTPEELPKMKPIVDLKSSENATLGTKFQTIGPSNTSSGGRPPRRSNVRMERIFGLNDNPNWKDAPVFESKLYYRSEENLVPTNNEHDQEDFVLFSDDDDDDDDEANKTDVPMDTSTATTINEGNSKATNIPLSQLLVAQMPLNDYKIEKIEQMNKWHQDRHKSQNSQDEAEAGNMLETCWKKIENSQNTQSVDESLKLYWDWHQRKNMWSPK